MNEVTVLLATYNGEAHLQEQLDSLFTQREWKGKILARDDKSTDRTLEILKKYPDRIEIVHAEERLGALGNFSALMMACNTPYMMFCDQDDVWKENKILITFQEIKRLEAIHGAEMPILVHTDLEVVDVNMNQIAPSYWDYAKLYPRKSRTLNRFLMQNVVTGCTAMFNQSLARHAAPIPLNATMHDWWTALSASAVGKIGVIDQQTIWYRQHQKNTLGAQPFCFKRGFNKLFSPNREIRAQRERAQTQAKELIKKFTPDTHQHELIAKFLSLYQTSEWKTRYLLLRHQLLRQGFMRNLATFLLPHR